MNRGTGLGGLQNKSLLSDSKPTIRIFIPELIFTFRGNESTKKFFSSYYFR